MANESSNGGGNYYRMDEVFTLLEKRKMDCLLQGEKEKASDIQKGQNKIRDWTSGTTIAQFADSTIVIQERLPTDGDTVILLLNKILDGTAKPMIPQGAPCTPASRATPKPSFG